MADIALIGTIHKYQAHGQPGADAFAGVVGSTLESHAFAAVAEEMNLEGLKRYDAVESVCKRVAESRGCPQLYCDPDTEAHIRHGIEDEGFIEADGKLSGQSPQEIRRRKDEAFKLREAYWLARLIELNRWPVLFVCGANHVDTFAEKRRASGRSVKILERDWEPKAE